MVLEAKGYIQAAVDPLNGGTLIAEGLPFFDKRAEYLFIPL